MFAKITLEDGTVVDAGDPKMIDLIAFERKFRTSVDTLGDEKARRLEHVLFLAWHVAKRNGSAVPADFDAFLENVADFDSEDDADPLDAAQPTPSV